ncbi:MAG: cytochrome c biogenesis protein CcdA [Planctomycetales bacterium]
MPANVIRSISLVLVLALGATCSAQGLKDIPGTKKNASKKPESDVAVSLEPATAKPGETLTLKFKITPKNNSHVYSSTSNGPKTTIDFETLDGVELIGPLTEDHPGKKHFEEDFGGDVEEYEEPVTFIQKLKIKPDAPPNAKFSGRLDWQACTPGKGGLCRPFKKIFEFSPVASAAGAPAAPAATPAPAKTPDSKPAPDVAQPEISKAAVGVDPRAQGLFSFLGAAFLAGLAALITPCVFPMVPITVSFFLKQAEKQHHRPLTMASVYCGAIIFTFVLLGMLISFLFGATAINTLANTAWLNIFLAAVLVFFAFNLLGMYEIYVPGWLLTYTAGKEALGGYLGVIFMALTFTLTSFTCTFAFLGLILVWSSQGMFWWPIVGLIAFSTAFALPFFLLALFPSYLAKLPRSGGWMNRVKVVMGLIELAFVFKFLSVADVSWNGMPALLDYHLVMSAWMVISICAGLYLLGIFRLPHDEPTEKTSVLAAMVAMSFLGFGSYLAVGLFGKEPPQGFLWNNIAAFAPPTFKGGSDVDGHFLIGEHDHLKYWLEFDSGLKEASRDNRPLFLDFTGVNCINCRKMEKILAQSHNTDRLKDLVRVQLYTDSIPNIPDASLVKKLLQQNRERQEKWFGDVTLPAYAVVSPDGKTLLAKFEGLESEQGDFAKFLDQGLAEWRKQSVAVTNR